MNRRVLLALALLIVGLTIGVVVSRLAVVQANAWLPIGAAFLAGIIVGALGMWVRSLQQTSVHDAQGEHDITYASSPAASSSAAQFVPSAAAQSAAIADTVAPLAPLALEALTEGAVAPPAAPPAVAETIAGSSRFALVRNANRYTAQVRDIGKYQSVKFSLVLPREWYQPNGKGTAERVETRAVLKSFARVETFAWVMFGLAILVYAFTRLYKLDEFPISFLGDEAVVATLARDLLHNGFHDPKLGWFPLYFNFFFVVNPLISVYTEAIAIQLFGVSINVVRATSAIVTIFGVAAVALTLKSFFQLRYWWVAVLFLAITPTWFFHSRTGFDTVTATALYGIFLLCYCLYRYRSPKFTFLLVLSGAALFYSYPSAQLVLALAALLLAISDIQYHFKNIKWWLYALPLIVLSLIPYARFSLEHPTESWYHLRSVDSYIVKDIPISEKITGFITRYAAGISPLYWFFPNEIDLMRHRMQDYGLLPLFELPLFIIGIGVCIARFRDSKYRLLLIALVATPFASALVDVLILRLLSFVIPATLLSVVGFEWLVNRFAKRLNPQLVSVALLLLLSFGSLWMLRDALVNGPTWFQTYDLYGMQWGAKQLFQVLAQIRQQSPKSPIVMTSSWANGTEQFIDFFLPNDKQIQTRTIDTWIENKTPLSRNTIFVMTPGELKQATDSNKFKPPEYVWHLAYPNGKPGFEFVRMLYVDNIDAVFQKEKEERAKPVTDQVKINGETVKVIHSQFDSGETKDMFDGDSYTLARGREANPLLIELDYPTPRPVTSLYASFGQMRFTATVSLFAPGSDKPTVYTQTSISDAPIPELNMTFDNPPAQVQRIKVEILHLDSPGEAKIHVRELQFK